jgi:UPF0755 protein
MNRAARWFVVVAVMAVVAAAGWYLALHRLSQPYRGYDAVEQFVDLLPGEGPGTIARKLVGAGVVSDRWTFRLALWRTGAARRLKAGEYRFDRPMTALEVVSTIEHGRVFVRPVTIPEGLTVREMSRIAEARGLGSAASFVAAARDAATAIEDIDPSARDLEGYLFPATYLLSRHASAADLVPMMVARFREVFTPELQAAAATEGLTPRQAITLASLVEKETARPEERPLVAGVYLRRLKVGMPLQCDPTVIYALALKNQYNGNLTRANLQIDSPYNTYRYPGLPPGPIAAPGRGSIEAAARPAAVDYLYFVSRNDGSHVFARTLDEHNRNVRQYQVEYFRRQETEGRR